VVQVVETLTRIAADDEEHQRVSGRVGELGHHIVVGSGLGQDTLPHSQRPEQPEGGEVGKDQHRDDGDLQPAGKPAARNRSR